MCLWPCFLLLPAELELKQDFSMIELEVAATRLELKNKKKQRQLKASMSIRRRMESIQDTDIKAQNQGGDLERDASPA